MAKPPLKSVEEKTRIVLAVLRGEVTMAEAAGREGVSQTTIAKWRDRFLDGGQAAIAAGGRVGSSREQRLEAEIDESSAHRLGGTDCGRPTSPNTKLQLPGSGI
jgi:transposase